MLHAARWCTHSPGCDNGNSSDRSSRKSKAGVAARGRMDDRNLARGRYDLYAGAGRLAGSTATLPFVSIRMRTAIACAIAALIAGPMFALSVLAQQQSQPKIDHILL